MNPLHRSFGGAGPHVITPGVVSETTSFYQLRNLIKSGADRKEIMKLNYTYVDPGGNPTVLVLDQISRKSQPSVANRIMKNFEKPCEQVGFLEPPKSKKAICRLQMMGGEFCGNALRATAAFLYFDLAQPLSASSASGLTRNGIKAEVVETSGTNRLIKICAKRTSRGIWAETEVPTPSLKWGRVDRFEMTCVDLEGITHFLVPQKYFNKQAQILNLLSSLKIAVDAYGLVFYEKVIEPKFSIIPIVRVRKTGTMIYETSCASGSLALAIAENKNIFVRQPSGYDLKVSIDREKRKASIGGLIASIKQGQMNI